MFVDSHAHIDGDEFDEDRNEVVLRANEAGVVAILNVGTGDPRSGNFERAINTAEKYPHVYAAVGVHPHDARLYTDKDDGRLVDLIKSSKRVLALGEIGLDFHYDNSPREIQREVFARQLQLAQRLDLPVIIHSREADHETVEILEANRSKRKGVMHCFGGSLAMANKVLELGFFISFAGNVTFKKAELLRDVARSVPTDRILIETDCPYLTPVPFRGRRNEPARVVETARCLAELRGMELEAFGRATSENFARLFGLSLEVLSGAVGAG